MANIPARVATRLADGLKKFQPILASAKDKDVNESNTVVIITDMLAEIFGFDKYTEITTEHAIKNTWCDLAIQIDGSIRLLLEVKAIGLELKENHVKQAVDYAANKGVDWVVLTNGRLWKFYKVTFSKPIGQELIVDVDLLALNAKKEDHIQLMYLGSKESMQKSALDEFYTQRQATSKFILGNLILTDDVVNVLRRELRQIFPDIKVLPEDIRSALERDVLKRDVVEGEEAERARKKIARADRQQSKPRGEPVAPASETREVKIES
jgi:hypothetical protein